MSFNRTLTEELCQQEVLRKRLLSGNNNKTTSQTDTISRKHTFRSDVISYSMAWYLDEHQYCTIILSVHTMKITVQKPLHCRIYNQQQCYNEQYAINFKYSLV